MAITCYVLLMMPHHDALSEFDGLAFETDRTGTIEAIGENNWIAFASENGAPELNADAVIGENLFDFIRGEQVRDQIKKILNRISQDPNWSWVLPFRCDAPDRERSIRQSLRPVFTEHVCTGFRFHSYERFSKQRPPLGIYDFKRLHRLARENHSLPVVAMCSWCQRVQYSPVGGEVWISAEDYYAGGGRSEVRLSHGICEECHEDLG